MSFQDDENVQETSFVCSKKYIDNIWRIKTFQLYLRRMNCARFE